MQHHHGSAVPDMLPSSPPALSSSPANPFLSPTRTSRRKEKRNPSVTPRRFGRFFTPRSTLPTESRAALGLLNASATNRQLISPQSLAADPLSSDPICPSSPTEALGHVDANGEKRKRAELGGQTVPKRRRGLLVDDTSPPTLRLPGRSFHMSRDGNVQMVEQSQTDARDGLDDRRRATLSHFFKASRSGSIGGMEEKSLSVAPSLQPSELRTNLTLEGYQPEPIRKLRNRGFAAQLLDREHGFASHTGRQYLSFPACDPRTLTASFYSESQDTHLCTSYTSPGNTIPFSLASCHGAPVTVIGDEQGIVRFFNTDTTHDPFESKIGVHVKVHDNAIMDLDLSVDDCRLATASGDRTGKIVDVMTQTVAVELASGHWDSLRQIAFQPGACNGSTLATSDRAGRVQIWDLRCSSMPTQCFSAEGVDYTGERDTTLEPVAAKTINTITNAHERTIQGTTSTASITAIQWLPSGREHLLLTASEANASIKLWDTRYIKPRRQAEETPLAITPQPTSHAWRSYGITSMALSTDASRLYAVCKDSTIYAYSTSHLMLGHAPELDDSAPKRKPSGAQGLGPLYGFKHDFFRASSFYVKCALRHRTPANNYQEELLAVGSSDSCAVLFPTDERYLYANYAKQAHRLDEPTPSHSATPSSPPSSVPIFRAGTPLAHGHSREVTTLNWSHHGKLVTASDDYLVRHWQADANRARYLRQVGDFGPDRHMAGWADVLSVWDADDDDDEH
ncbi:WD domain-containing protein [Pochonia chlamydosporia 170]|uniref:WD domain-containing protein n=1 Tax=Pochonia chlamydosporia 170 TaxID=1380566 RepID=A0A179FIL0_METCM|nr:WD domain-containing protein [Pochonia chlamydosporia 170]OAQ64849.1 WD domain-containing protein [Pochonia chlamydosporia 170]